MRRNVVELVQHRRPAHPRVVRLLQGMLERARRGEVRSVMVGTVTDDGCAGYCWTLGDGSIATLMAANAYLAADLVAYRGE